MAALLPGDVVGAWAGLILPFGRGGAVDGGALAVQLERLVEAGVAGFFAADDTGELAALDEAQARSVHERLAELGAEVGLPVVLDGRAEGLERAARRLALGAELDPAAWLVCAPPTGSPEDLAHLEALARAADPASLIVEEPHSGAFGRASLARWNAALPQVVGARIQPRDEEGWSELMAVAEHLALFAAGREWAAASRWGARSSSSELVALSPELAVATAELLERDVQRALRRERRFQHLLEAHALPLLRRSALPPHSLGRLLALAGAWCPSLERGPTGHNLLPPARLTALRSHTRATLDELRGE